MCSFVIIVDFVSACICVRIVGCDYATFLFERNTWNNLTVCQKWDHTRLKILLTKCVLQIIYIQYINSHLDHHVMPLAQISLTLSHYISLSFIASGRSSGLHPVSSHSCCVYIRAGRPAFVWPYAGVHRSTSLMSSSLLLQQCPACLGGLTCIVFVMGRRWPYCCCLLGCCRQDLFNIALNILVQLPSSFFFSRLVSIHVVHPYSSIK